MFVLPAEIAVTKPVLLTVAMPVFEETQGFVFAAVPVPVNCEVVFTQRDEFPLTFTPPVNNAETVQPVLLEYVIVVVPFAKTETKPVLLTVAIDGLDDIQGLELAAVPVPVNCDVPFIQLNKLPEIVLPERLVTVTVP